MRRSVLRGYRCLCLGVLGAWLGASTGALATTSHGTLTLNVPNTQVVYTTLRAGAYADATQGHDLETKTTTDASVLRRGILKFDTQNTMPLGTAVTSASLRLTVQSGGTTAARHIAAYQMTQSWDETEATWNVRRTNEPWQSTGGDLGAKLAEQVVGTAPGTTVTFDVTSLVSQAVAGTLGSSRYTRIALVDIDPPDNESRRIYATPDDANPAARPTLTVTYGGSPTQPPAPAPPPVPPPTNSSTLRVLQYNVQHGGVGTDGVYDPNRVVDWMAKLNPDIISVCELESHDSYVSTDGVALYQSLLEAKTGVKWYTWDIQDYGAWTAPGIRNAILSKIPFSAAYRHEFSVGRDRTVGGVTISVNGRTINFMSTHTDPYDTSNRIEEDKELVTYANGFAEDRILAGDFNDQPDSTSIGYLTPRYYDAWAVGASERIATAAPDNPNGYTRHSRIDYVFYSRTNAHLTLKSVQVVDTRDAHGVTPSDHRPLLAVFQVN